MRHNGYSIPASAPIPVEQGRDLLGACPRCGHRRQVRKVKGVKLAVVSLCQDCRAVLSPQEKRLWK